MPDLNWSRYPNVAEHEQAKAWLLIQANLGLAHNTLDAYARALEDYLRFSASRSVLIKTAAREHIAAYVHELASRPHPRSAKVLRLDSGAGLANAALQQRLTALRLYYDYLLEEGLRETNPVGSWSLYAGQRLWRAARARPDPALPSPAVDSDR